MELHERIRMLMNELHMSQKELAERSNITESSISKYLNGERTPRVDIIVNIAKALGVTADELIGDDIEKSPDSNLARLKMVLARGMDTITDEEKKELINLIVEAIGK